METKEKEKDSRRSFEFQVSEDETKTYYLGMPTSEQIRKADWHYSKVYNKALVEGIATESEMTSILLERGIIGKEYEMKKQELQLTLATKLLLLDELKEEEEKAKLALEVRNLRDELYKMNQQVTGPLSNTCEQMANDAKTEYLTSVVLQNEDGSLVWDSYDDFIAEGDQRLVIKSRYEVILWMEGLDQDFLENTPENVVLREIADARRKAAEIKRLEAAEDSDSKETTEEEATAEAPKKRARRKSASKKTT